MTQNIHQLTTVIFYVHIYQPDNVISSFMGSYLQYANKKFPPAYLELALTMLTISSIALRPQKKEPKHMTNGVKQYRMHQKLLTLFHFKKENLLQ